jgi:hypothetical protein
MGDLARLAGVEDLELNQADGIMQMIQGQFGCFNSQPPGLLPYCSE